MNTSFIPGPLDIKTRLEQEITKTADFDGTPLDLGPGFAPQSCGQTFAAVVDVKALDFADTDESYSFIVEQSSDNGSWTPISAPVERTEIGAFSIPVFVSARYVRLKLDVDGTTPSVKYEAWLVPIE